MQKGSGFFNMCIGKKCAAESPRKTPRNNTFKVNNPMRNVIKTINSVVKSKNNNNNNNNNNNSINNRVSKAVKGLNITIEKLEKFKNTLKNSKNISLKKDQIKTLKNLKEALLMKDPSKVNKKFQKNVINRTLKK